MACDEKCANLWVSRIIPFILVAIVGFGTYVVIEPLCIHYLINPRVHGFDRDPRRSAAIGIIVVYFILLLVIIVAYLRLLAALITNPGYIPRGDKWEEKQRLKKEARRSQRRPHKGGSRNTRASPEHSDKPEKGQDAEDDQVDNHEFRIPASPYANEDSESTPPGLEYFYSKDVFQCANNGRPRWCDVCLNWKPDRAHHCREVGRCVYKMDHFCPWVGGIISETNFKFFVQFTTYGAVFTGYIIIVLAVFIAEMGANIAHSEVILWIIAMALAGLFFLFAIGMTSTSVKLILANRTTIEDIGRGTRNYLFAVYIPRFEQYRPSNFPFQTVTFADETSPRTFAVISTQKGSNPWDLGSSLENWKQVMGFQWKDWILPWKYSPCCDHEKGESMYLLNPAILRWRKARGLVEGQREGTESRQSHASSKRKRRRRRRRHSTSSQFGIGGLKVVDDPLLRNAIVSAQNATFGDVIRPTRGSQGPDNPGSNQRRADQPRIVDEGETELHQQPQRANINNNEAER